MLRLPFYFDFLCLTFSALRCSLTVILSTRSLADFHLFLLLSAM